MPVHGLGASASVDLRWTVALRRLLVRGRFDVLHAHLPYTAAFGRLVALQRRPGAGARPSSTPSTACGTRRPCADQGAQPVAPSGARPAPCIVVSVAARDALPRGLRARARVVVHGIDRSRFAASTRRRAALRRDVRAELGVADDEVVALTVANLRSEKGYDVLLEAARLAVAARRPRCASSRSGAARSRPSWPPRRPRPAASAAHSPSSARAPTPPASWPVPTSSSCRRTKRGCPWRSWRR